MTCNERPPIHITLVVYIYISLPDKQSLDDEHALPFSQKVHSLPPQSISVSSPDTIPSKHVDDTQYVVIVLHVPD